MQIFIEISTENLLKIVTCYLGVAMYGKQDLVKKLGEEQQPSIDTVKVVSSVSSHLFHW